MQLRIALPIERDGCAETRRQLKKLIYRLIARGTIEERIIELHASKRDLADNLLEGTDRSGKLSAKELLKLIQN